MSLFRSKEPQPASDKIENVLGPSVEGRGDLKAEGGIRIDGAFEGTVETEGNIIVGESAHIVADMGGFNVTVAGVVEGNVRAVGRLEILSTGRVVGDVQADSFLIEEGGVFRGQSLMEKRDEQGSPETARSAESTAQPDQGKPGEKGTQDQKRVARRSANATQE